MAGRAVAIQAMVMAGNVTAETVMAVAFTKALTFPHYPLTPHL
jgi:hypothetical protein